MIKVWFQEFNESCIENAKLGNLPINDAVGYGVTTDPVNTPIQL